MSSAEIHRIAVIGNAGAGKTTLSRNLARVHNLPLTHVDAIQFVAGMKIRPHAESIQILNEIQAGENWIVDGYGPLDILETRLARADRIVMIDFPLWRHYWWCSKRQIKNLWSPRAELPEGCDEVSFAQTVKLFKALWRVHQQMRPELLRILGRDKYKKKVVMVHTLQQWRRIFRHGLD